MEHKVKVVSMDVSLTNEPVIVHWAECACGWRQPGAFTGVRSEATAHGKAHVKEMK